MNLSGAPRRPRVFSPRVAGLCALLLLLTPWLRVEEEDVVFKVGFRRLAVPGACLFKTLTGLDCPFCGLSRGFVCAAHLQFGQATGHNWASLPVLVFVLFYALGGLIEHLRQGRAGAWRWSGAALSVSKTALVIVCLAGWLAKMLLRMS